MIRSRSSTLTIAMTNKIIYTYTYIYQSATTNDHKDRTQPIKTYRQIRNSSREANFQAGPMFKQRDFMLGIKRREFSYYKGLWTNIKYKVRQNERDKKKNKKFTFKENN